MRENLERATRAQENGGRSSRAERPGFNGAMEGAKSSLHDEGQENALGAAGAAELAPSERENDQGRDASANCTLASRRAWVRMTLISDYHLASAFISVPKLAAILGLSPSTIWSHMRLRKFPIPYRMINTSPMVCIDDLVDWYCSRDDLIFPEDEAPKPRKSAREQAEEERARRKKESDAIVANALAAVGVAPSRRGRQRH